MFPRLRRYSAFAALLSFALAPSSALLAAEPDDVADADVPPFAQPFDKEAYLRARAEHIDLLRGVPTFLPYDARARALAELEAQEMARTPQIDLAFWTQLGPAPIPNGQTSGTSTPVSGRVSAIAVDPTDEDIVYVGAAQGGVYRSLNGGTSWTQIFDSAATLAIGALAIAPSDPDILYVGTGESAGSADSFFGVGVYRIDDARGDATLSGPFNPEIDSPIVAPVTAFTGRAISEVLVHPTDPATIFVSTTSGTGGNPSGGPPGFDVPPLALRGVYRSTNATSGAPSFTKLTVATAIVVMPDTTGNVPVTDIAMDPTNPNLVVAWANGDDVATGGGLYTSTNALATPPTFTQTLVTTTENVRGELAVNRVGGVTTFYAATGEGPPGSQGRLRRSTDGGATWSAFLAGAVNFCNPQCFYDIAVDVHPGDANILNVGGSPNLIAGRSTDAGATFTTNAQTANGVHVDTHAVAIAASSPSVVYLGTDGGIYRSNDAGLTWTPLNNVDFHATQFQGLALHPRDRQFLIGGTQDNGTQFLKPDATWFRADFGDGGHALIDQNAVDTTNVTMYHTYFNQNTAKGFARVTNVAAAVDNGWQGYGCGFGGFIPNGISCAAGDTTLFYAPMALGPGTPNTLYFGSEQLWRSADQGVTMPAVSQVLFDGQPITAIGIAPGNDNVRLAGTRNGRIFATTTGANPLLDVTNAGMPLPFPGDTNLRRAVSALAVDPSNPNVAYAAFGGYGVTAGHHVWKTTNLAGGAAFWAPAGTGIPDVPVNNLEVEPNHPETIYAATDIGVYLSRDAGATWFPYSESLPRVAVFDVAFFNGNEKVVRIATHGRGIWERTPPHDLFEDGFESGDHDRWSTHFPP